MNITQARHALGMSLSEFADLHGMSTDAVRRWERPAATNGYREPSGSAKAFTQALLDGYRPKGICKVCCGRQNHWHDHRKDGSGLDDGPELAQTPPTGDKP